MNIVLLSPLMVSLCRKWLMKDRSPNCQYCVGFISSILLRWIADKGWKETTWRCSEQHSVSCSIGGMNQIWSLVNCKELSMGLTFSYGYESYFLDLECDTSVLHRLFLWLFLESGVIVVRYYVLLWATSFQNLILSLLSALIVCCSQSTATSPLRPTSCIVRTVI